MANFHETRKSLEYKRAWEEYLQKVFTNPCGGGKIKKGWFSTEDGTHIYVDSEGNARYGADAYSAYQSDSGGSNSGGVNIEISQEQRQNLEAIAIKLGCTVGEPMSSDEALAGANFSWNERQQGAVTLPQGPTNAAIWAAQNDPELMQEIEKYETEYAKTIQALSAQEFEEIDKYSVNCPSTVMAYELRARGLDVTAMPVTGKSGPAVFKNLVWENAQIQQAKDGLDFQELTKNDPDTARYGVIVKNDFTNHTMVATREGGSLKIVDTQLGVTYSPEVFQATKYSYSADYKYTPRTEKYEVYSLKSASSSGKVFGQIMKEDTTIAFYRIDTLTIDESKIGNYVQANK